MIMMEMSKAAPPTVPIGEFTIPRHVAIIMDGNGRWAAQRHLPRVEGHRAGIDSVRDVVESSARLGIDVLTLYAFSVENWKRPRAEPAWAALAASCTTCSSTFR